MEHSKIILPKEGVGVFYIIGAFLLFFATLHTVNIVSSYPYPVIYIRHFVTSITLFLISMGWFTYRKSGVITGQMLTIRWHIYFIVLFKKEIRITTFDSIFVKVTRFSSYYDGALSRTEFYDVTLADSSVFDFDTWVVISSDVYKKIYSVTDHYNWSKRSENSLIRCIKVVESISRVTGLKIIYSDEVKEELTNLEN